MLRYLHIRNIAVIDELEVEFSDGLSVITGETGSGKSIIIDSLELLLGSKASSELIRSGEEQALVEGLFTVPPSSPVWSLLAEQGIDHESSSGGTLMIRRGIAAAAPNKSFVNGVLVPVGFLRELGQYLVEIHGQHDSRILLQPKYHRELLDGFHNERGLLDEVAQLARRIEQTRRALAELNRNEHDRLQRLDLLNFQIREIETAGLQPDEEGRLTDERNILANAERLLQIGTRGYERLYEAEDSVMNELNRILQDLEEGVRIDPSLEKVLAGVQGAIYQLEDAAYAHRDYAQRIEYNEERLNDVETRLALLDRLKRKYGGSIVEILDFFNRISAERSGIESADERKENLAGELGRLRESYGKTAGRLTTVRTRAARRIEKAIEEHLRELGMTQTRFKVNVAGVEHQEHYPTAGIDDVEFLVSPNVGEDLRPLHKVASGGELSRITLALKLILHAEPDLTLIFDEVDSGIGGATAEIVGRKLLSVSRQNQTFCITHVPQIAALGEHHFLVDKKVVGRKTMAGIRCLERDDRVEEVARMLGGISVTDLSREHARQLIATGVSSAGS
ncbi:MAG: DNA repair protein RecN [Acidobacteria bacterium]|nr:DNA repair protein RecN [Acidobacteriota bacterium]